MNISASGEKYLGLGTIHRATFSAKTLSAADDKRLEATQSQIEKLY